MSSDHARDDRASGDTHPKREALAVRRIVARDKRLHIERHVSNRIDILIRSSDQPPRGHVGVSDRFNLLNFVALGKRIELAEDVVEQQHRFIRRHLLRQMGEIDDVCKYQTHVRISVCNICFLTLQSVSDIVGQDVQEQALRQLFFR